MCSFKNQLKTFPHYYFRYKNILLQKLDCIIEVFSKESVLNVELKIVFETDYLFVCLFVYKNACFTSDHHNFAVYLSLDVS